MSDDTFPIGAYLTREQRDTFERIKAYYGIERNSDGIRLLIQQVARQIDRLATTLDTNPPATP